MEMNELIEEWIEWCHLNEWIEQNGVIMILNENECV